MPGYEIVLRYWPDKQAVDPKLDKKKKKKKKGEENKEEEVKQANK